MARLPRVTQSIFAGSATNNGVFGSAQASGGTLSNVLATIMGLGAWTQGWLDAVIGGSKFPPLEEFQAVEYVHSSQIAYLLQQGIAEYDAGTTYWQKNLCIKAGTYQLYGSVTDANIGNALTDPTNWLFLCDLSNIGGASTGDVKPTLKTAADNGWILANDGAIGDAAFNTAVVANSMAITATGAGYAVDDYVFFVGGAAIVVTGVSGGAIASFNEVCDGLYSATPGGALAQASTTGSGAGATLTITTTALAGGLYYSNAAAQALFELLWTNFPDYYCPVTGGRGGSAAADWGANKGIRLPRAVGRALAVAGSGVSLSARALGQFIGDEHTQQHNHTINDPTHAHGILTQGALGQPYSAATGSPGNAWNFFGMQSQSSSTGITNNSYGTGFGGNMQPTLFMNIMIKL